MEADIPGNSWFLARFGFDAVHGDGIELVTRIFQNQGFPTLYHDVIGNDFACVALGDFPFALNGKIMLDIDIPEDQRSVLDILSQAAHALDMGEPRRDVHVGAVIQHADSVTGIAYDAGFRVRLELQRLSCIDVGIGNIRVCIAHLEALFTIQGNSIPSEHGSQTEIIIIFYIPNKHVFIGTGLYQVTAQGNVQRLCRSSDALRTADKNQVVGRDIGLVAIQCVVDSFFGKNAHVARCALLGCIDSANVNGRSFLLRIGAASHGDGATSLHVQYAAFLQINPQWNVTHNLERLYIAVFVTIDGNIGGICVHKLLHICNIICS